MRSTFDGVWIPAAALIVALAFSSSLSAQIQPNDPTTLSPDLAIIPSDVRLFACVNLTKYWDSDESESLNRIANAHPVVFTWAFRDMPSAMGLPPDNIVRLTMFNTGIDGACTIFTKRPYDRQRVLAAIAPESMTKSAGGRTYFHSSKSNNDVYILDDHTLVLGLPIMGQNLPAFLSRPLASERDPSLDRALLASQHGAPFVVHAGPGLVRSIAAEKDMRYGPLAPLAHAHAWQIFTVLDKQLTIDLRADFDSQEEAEQSSAAFSSIGETLFGITQLYRSHMDPFLEREAAEYPGSTALRAELDRTLDATAIGLKEVRTKSVKKTAGARIEIKTDKPVTSAVLLVSMLPRGEKKR